MKTLIAAAVLGALIAPPAYARHYHPYHLDHPRVGPDGQIEISAARAQALRECNAVAAQWGPEYEWGNTPIYHYRACMTEHGQVE
jgi:hypothetical protein